MNLLTGGETATTLSERLGRALKVFAVMRPLLVTLASHALVPAASRMAVSIFVQSLDALAALMQAADGDGIADFKAGRDL